MRASLLILGALFVAVSLTYAQSVQRVADGVSVLSIERRHGDPVHNVGLIEFEDYVLAVDGCDEELWGAVAGAARETYGKPVRFVAATAVSSASECDVGRGDATLLVPSIGGRAAVDNGRAAFPGDVSLHDGRQRAILRSLHADGMISGWTVAVGDAGVLFVGDLVGPGRASETLPTDSWIEEIGRLERLDPSVVVPGSGPPADAELLRQTRMALDRAKSRVAQLVDEGLPRDRVIREVRSTDPGALPEGTVELIYDEHAGLLPATAFIERIGLREGPSPTAGNPGWTPPRKVVIADLWPGRTAQLGRAAPGVEVLVAKDPRHAAELVEDADAILGWLTPGILTNAQRVRWVALFSAGVESYLTIPGFSESDIVLTNGQRLYARGGAEHVIGMALALSRRLHTAVHLQSERRWDNTPLTGPTPISGDGSELGEFRGKTLLVVGLGGIGTEVARLAHGIGMRVIATRASRREGPPFVEYVGLSHELRDLAADADVIVNCVPLTPQTEGMFDDGFFATTKPTAFFVNIGRGKTVDTEALVAALREGRIAGAGLDVTDPEPLPSDHELWGMQNVIITPHVGGDSERHMKRIWLLFRENLRRFAVGEPLLSVVNKQRGY